VRAYVINLARAPDRWAVMERRLDAARLPYVRVEAVDGRTIQLPIPEFDEWTHRLMTGRRPIPAEIGCYLSHLRAIDAFLATEDGHALILEDDALFDPSIVDAIAAAIEQEHLWDVLRLSTVGRDRAFRVLGLGDGRSLGVNLTRCKGAGAYVLNRRAAVAFRRFLVPMRLAYDIAFDLEYFHALRAVAVVPYPVVQNRDVPSQIQIGIESYKLPHWRYLTVFPYRAVVEVARVVMRAGLIARTCIASRRRCHRSGPGAPRGTPVDGQ
jgi:glycosyl transferase family 25